MKLNRRKFIAAAGTVAAGAMILPQWACKSGGDSSKQNLASDDSAASPAATPGLSVFGIQLYTVRDVIPGDPKGVMKELADYGYRQFEGYEHDKLGIFWGMRPADFKQYMDEIGVDFVASHCDTGKDFEKKAAQAGEIGMKYLISPWVGPQKKMDDWRRIADEFNNMGEICRKNGIRFAYHNHGYSFQELEGVIPQNFLIENTDPGLVDFEIDIYWAETAGADSIAYLQKYPERFRLCHIKDRKKDAAPGEGDASCDLGTGNINFSKILKVARNAGMQYYLVEQERYDDSSPMQSAKVGAEYLSQLVLS